MSLCKSVKQRVLFESAIGRILTNASDLSFKEVQYNAQNLSTQKASEKKRARFQKENENV